MIPSYVLSLKALIDGEARTISHVNCDIYIYIYMTTILLSTRRSVSVVFFYNFHLNGLLTAETASARTLTATVWHVEALVDYQVPWVVSVCSRFGRKYYPRFTLALYVLGAALHLIHQNWILSIQCWASPQPHGCGSWHSCLTRKASDFECDRS
jgi:hypothetical protein